MYEQVTRSIRVRVRPEYLEAQSAPEDGRYFWSYTVEILNEGSETVQLRHRYWHITDSLGRVQEVRGAGVVGEQPVLKPGEAFEYTSGCRLRTASGTMRGSYFCVAEDGERFEVDIPEFVLDDGSRRVLH